MGEIKKKMLIETLKQYRAVYQEFMGHTDAEMPCDESLINIVLRNDMEIMKKYIEERKYE